ncbi:MAG: S8 family serine peptidase [Prolixibacteraceae bacterium]|nr:S8 family serine peptidase [Prolixibacteraceae bacterium]
MKKINLTLIVILFTSFVYAQNDYYWSAGKKHFLKQQTNAFVVKLQEELTFDNARKIKSDRNLKELTIMKRNLGIIVANDTLVNSKKLKEYEEFSNAMPVYQLGDLPFFLTGEILMHPKDNVFVENILKLVNNKVSVKDRTKYNTYVLETDDWDKLLVYSNLIYESGLVEYCHPNFIAPRQKFQINDPKYSEQYYLNNTGQFGGTTGIDINAPEAWGITTGNCPVTVAVIDDGVEDHEDLNGRVLQGFTPQFSLLNPDTHGGPNENDPPDGPVGHGQCCAGIIGATHNSLGIRGVAPEVNVVPINIFNDWFIYSGKVYYSEDALDNAAAIDFAWSDAEADILSNSWGYNTTAPEDIPDADEIIAAIGRARNQGRNGSGSIVVFASGNFNQDFSGVTFPANVDGVITVGAVDKNGSIWNYSSRGSEMDLVAPSGALGLIGDVRTIDREGSDGYETGNYTDRFGGTSAACPQVSGVAALMLSVRPDLTESQVRSVLQQTAIDMGTSGFDNTYGYGRVNAYAAVHAVYPYISGLANLCSSGATYSVVNAPPGVYVRWEYSNNIESYYGGNTWIALRATGNGEGWVGAHVPVPGCDTLHLPRMTVWAGIPTMYSFYTEVNGEEVKYYEVAQICPSTINCFDAEPEVEEMDVIAEDYTWHLPQGFTVWGPNGNGLCFDAHGTIGSPITGDVTNACGTGYGVIQIYLADNGCRGAYRYAISPNPVSTVLTVEQLTVEEAAGRAVLEPVEVYGVPEKGAADKAYTVEIWHEKKGKVMAFESENKREAIDVSRLEKGHYILHICTKYALYQELVLVE